VNAVSEEDESTFGGFRSLVDGAGLGHVADRIEGAARMGWRLITGDDVVQNPGHECSILLSESNPIHSEEPFVLAATVNFDPFTGSRLAHPWLILIEDQVLLDGSGDAILRAAEGPLLFEPPPRASLVAQRELTIPDPWSKTVSKWDLSPRDHDRYWDLIESTRDEEPKHRILGYSDMIHTVPEEDAQDAARDQQFQDEMRSEPWSLALQIEADERLGLEFGDDGRLFVCSPQGMWQPGQRWTATIQDH
jgi:hypothetical protein